jgi:hypothetical protein
METTQEQIAENLIYQLAKDLQSTGTADENGGHE